MGTLHRWMRRLQQFFNGDPADDQEVETNKERTHTKSKSFQVENKKSESKVVYQYPKKGNFRFPIIDDPPQESVQRKSRQTLTKKTNAPTMKKEKEVEQIDKKWNQNSKSEFKLSEIPSPIYGFKGRETAKSKLGDSVSVLPFEDKSKKEVIPLSIDEVDSQVEKTVKSVQSNMNPKVNLDHGDKSLKTAPEDLDEMLEPIEEVEPLTKKDPGRPYGVPTILEEALLRATSQQEEERMEEESGLPQALDSVLEEKEEKTEESIVVDEVEQLQSVTEEQNEEIRVEQEVQEVEEIQEVEEVQEVEEIQEVEEVQEEQEVQGVEEVQEEREVQGVEEVQEEREVQGVEEVQEEQEVQEVKEILEEQEVQEVKEVLEEQEVPEVKEARKEHQEKQVANVLKERKVEENNYIEVSSVKNENRQEHTEKKDEHPQEQIMDESEQISSAESRKLAKEKQDQKSTDELKAKKAAIPFNVMMLPQDRKKKQTQVSSPSPAPVKSEPDYSYPGIQLLNYPEIQEEDESEWLNEQGTILEETLLSFHVDAKVVHVTKGPSVTRFEIQPGRGVKVTKITGLTDDMKLALAAKDIRIEAPIPGKNTIGIEVPNRASTPVFLREILRRKDFIRSESPLTVALGLDISGQPIVTDLKKMPHGLVAGATGSGKSVCINSVLISLLFKATPDEVKLMLIDPKMVELAPYNGLPHLVTPVITDAKQATAALKWVVQEMERRYELFSQQGVRDVGRYNEIYSETPDKPALPLMLVVIDELADLMMVSPQEVEDSICRIAQKARACGIHLLLATQRPSVDVITGLIKANIPTRIAFSVSSQTDSRTILDMGGAERLLGRGDMLFHENGSPKPVRVQGTFVSDQEIEDVVAHVKKQREPEFLLETEQLKHVAHGEVDDEHFEEACYFVIEQGSASASSLQRRFRVGYNRAARLIDMMEDRGIVSEAMGSKPRHVLVDEIELEEVLYHKEG